MIKDFENNTQPHENGTLLAAFATPRALATAPGRYVLVYLGEGRSDPFATWWENTESGGCIHGHYFQTLQTAQADFLKRCAA